MVIETEGGMSENIPDWLPKLEYFEDYNDWDQYVDALYEIYVNDFIRNKFQFHSKRVSTRRLPYTHGKDRTFWHIIQEGKNEGDRIPAFRRCERIRWPKAIIINHRDSQIKMWNYQKRKIKGTKPRTYLWFNNEFLVILEKRPSYVLFITAYPTDRRHSIEKLEKEFNEVIKADVAGATSETPSTHGR